MTYFIAKANELQEVIDRLRKLHYKVPYEPGLRIANVYDACGGCMNGWPCQTIKVLDNDPETIKALLPEGVCCQYMNVCYDVTCPECDYDYWGCANCRHIDPCTRCEKRKQLDDEVQ